MMKNLDSIMPMALQYFAENIVKPPEFGFTPTQGVHFNPPQLILGFSLLLICA